MATLTIALPEERMLELNEVASRLGVKPEELVQVSVEQLLARPDEAFQLSIDYVLLKNVALYRRLD